jgi:energy-coupling factor transport system permease protein
MRKLSYQPGSSIAHQLYPLTKFAWLLIATVLFFLIQDGRLLMATAGLCALALFSINRDIWRIRGFRFILITGIALFFLYLVFDKSGQVLLNPGYDFLVISSGGLLMGLRFSGRFLAIVFMSYIFILTTDPSDLAYALMKVGLPYRYGFMLVTALRLAPVMEEEGQTIYRAQLVRGIRYDRGNLRKMVLIIQQFMTPLLISALRRADKLVFSMEGRGFGKQSQRTFRKRPPLTILDLKVSLAMTLYFVMLITLNYWSLT